MTSENKIQHVFNPTVTYLLMQEGRIERLRALSVPDTRVQDPDGLTLLHWATDRGHEDIVTMLVDTDPELINMQVINMFNRQ